MNYTRGWHPRRKVTLRNLVRHSRGCDAGSWQRDIRLTKAAGVLLDRGGDDVFIELDDLVEAHSASLHRLNWYVPYGKIVRDVSRRFDIRTLCFRHQKLDTLIGRRES